MCVCVCVMVPWILQGEQLPPRPLTPEPTLRFLPRLLPLGRRCPGLQPLPGLQAPLGRPVTTPSAQVTPTWPPPPWWLQPGTGSLHSVAEAAAGRSGTAAPQTCLERVSRTHLRLHLVLLQALVHQKTDPSVKECIHYLPATLDF